MLATMIAGLLALQGPTVPGATLRLYDIGAQMDDLWPLVPGQTPNVDRLIDAIDLKDGEFARGFKDFFVAEVSADFLADADGNYVFRLTSDDGSILELDGATVADNGGIHPAQPVESTVRLQKGPHKLKVRYFENNGQERLLLEVRRPEKSGFAVVDKSMLRSPGGLTRVTSPGTKRLLRPGGPMRPGNGMPLAGIHPGWDLVNIRPADFKPQVGALTFLPDGSLLVSTFKPNQTGTFQPDLKDGKIWRLTGVTGNDRSQVKVQLVAQDIQEPLGLATIGNDVYLSQRSEITQLVDKDADGVYEGTKTVAKAWVSDNYHHFTFGLASRDGLLYASLSTSITPNAPGINGPNPPNRGTVMVIDPALYDPDKPMQNVQFLTGGHRTPNGIEFGPHGLLLVGENQGAWQPANKINVVQVGGFYGHYNNTEFKTESYPNGGVKGPYDEQPLMAPALYLPQNECANSPAQAVTVPSGPMKDQILISDVKYGGLRRAWLEQVDGVWQGGVVQYSQGFEVGTNRMVFGPDGALYIGGIGATETWAWTDPRTGQWTTYGLQKIKPNGKVAFEIASVQATPTGLRLKFTKPARSPNREAAYLVRQWNYEPTPEYGGDKKNREDLKVTRAKASMDGTEVDLMIPGLDEGRVVYVNCDVKSAVGEPLWASECWYTLNKKPSAPAAATSAWVTPKPRVLVLSETKGFRHDSIPAGIEAVKKLAAEKGFTATFTEDSSVFARGLDAYDVVLFLNTTGDVLDEREQAGLQRFIADGGGFVGVHSATDTEADWPWYVELVGATFKSHPAIQQAFIKIEDRAHPTTCFLPNNWIRVDEWYNFKANPRPRVRVLATLDEASYQGGEMGADHPIMWCREIDGGRSWYTELGHTASTYREPIFLESLYQGILWVAQAKRPAGAVALVPSDWNLTGWSEGGNASLGNGKIVLSSGAGVLGNTGPSPSHLISKAQYGDCRVHVEFMIPPGGNSGVYLQGRYEVQILDSFGKPWRDLQHSDCGGIYQRWKDDAGYEGTPPARNAVRPPGEWNTYDIVFRAPRFEGGRKTENARFVEVRLNGVVVQNDIEVTGPTRASMAEDEVALGPLFLQGDHGPVAFRNVWVLPLK